MWGAIAGIAGESEATACDPTLKRLFACLSSLLTLPIVTTMRCGKRLDHPTNSSLYRAIPDSRFALLSGAMGGGGGGGGLLGGIGGMVGKAINGVLGGFGGKLGEKLGGLADKITGGIMGLVGNVMGKHGEENTSNALQNETSQAMGNAIKITINNNNELPQAIKDQANEAIDNAVGGDKKPTTCECQGEVKETIRDALDDVMGSIAEESSKEADKASGSEGGGNWLVQLARALAKIQNDFLDAAMKNMETMTKTSEETAKGGVAGGNGATSDDKSADGAEGGSSKQDGTGDGAEKSDGVDEAQRQQFINAQSEYQANMKMFSTMAEATATSLKSIGDAMSSLSRKQ